MSKKKTQDEKYQKEETYKKVDVKDLPAKQQDLNIPPELKEKLEAIKSKLDRFQKILLEKFEKYIIGISLMPPPRPQPGLTPEESKRLEEQKDKIHVLVLVDDTEPTKMSKFELKDKLLQIIDKTALEIDPNILPQVLLLTELWQNCYDAKYDLLQLIALSAPVYDTGMLSAIKISEVHKTMVLKKFEKYIVTYVLAGSLVQGKATKESDIDVYIVIDDTDVKKMTRVELKDKLRAIIIGMGIEAGEITGIRNKINIQIYILTDYWESIKDAHPVIFTLLRDGVPFFDRGIFMAWKQLLKMGRIKPSPEAIDMYLSSGEQMLERIKFKMRDIAIEDVFWATHTPTNAALMMYGVAPATPKETAEVMREVFVKKEKLLAEEDVKIMEKIIQIRKDLEHGVKKDVTGKEVDELINNADKYLKRIKRLFTQIEKIKEEETIVNLYESVITIVRDLLKLEGLEKIPEVDVVHEFEDKVISTGKLEAKHLRLLHQVMKSKKLHDEGKLTKTDVEITRKDGAELVRALVECMQRRRGQELNRTKVRVKHGNKFGEITILGNTAFVIQDIDAEQKQVEKAKVSADGSLGVLEKSNLKELEQELAKTTISPRVFIKEQVFESLKKIFGKDVEILVSV